MRSDTRPPADPLTPSAVGTRAADEPRPRELTEALVRSSHDGIVAVDPDCRVQVWNRAMERLTGLPAEGALGLELDEAAAKVGDLHVAGFLRRALAGESVAATRMNVHHLGGTLTLEGQFAPMVDEEGHVCGAYWLLRDVSEQQQLEEQLLQAQKIEAVGQLAGGIAHDFNNLLTVILGYCELAQLRAGEDTEIGADLAEIRRAAERASALTRQLLAFSRKQVLQPEVLAPNEVVRDLEQMVRRLIGEDVQLATVLAPDVGTVLVDRGQLQQVLINLLVNARDAMPQGGRLLVETRNAQLDEHYARVHPGARPGSYVMFAVSDTGMGMDDSVRRRIFEPFFTTKERGKGTGLGLSMAYGVVKQSGGYIWVYSEPGHGTTFKVYFPRVDITVEKRSEDGGVAGTLEGTETILVAEDEEVVRGLLVRLLQMRGYRVIAADRAGAALAAAEGSSDLQLLITDVVMPDMSGRQLADRLLVRRPGLKVLFISGYTDESIASHGVLDPGVQLLEKPFTADVLGRRVREILDGPPRA
jgi:PAS domain S-box-containing protein